MPTDAEISAFLDAKEPAKPVSGVVSDEDIGSFLDKPAEIIEKKAKTTDEWYKPAIDIGAGATDSFLNLLDIPNSAYNWSAEKLGLDYRFPSTRDLGAELGIGYSEAAEHDTV